MTARALFELRRTLALVGMMGVGKSAIGKRVAQRLGVPFCDADHEIEAAAGCTVEEIFDRYGEPAFRDAERRVIERLLERPVQVIATGGGAFMDPATRALLGRQAVTLWLRADLDLMVARTARRTNRPLLKEGDPREILARLTEQRYPSYALADITIDSRDGPPEATVEEALAALEAFLDRGVARGARA